MRAAHSQGFRFTADAILVLATILAAVLVGTGFWPGALALAALLAMASDLIRRSHQ